MNTYRHTQFGTVIVVTTAAIIPLAALPAWLAGIATAAWLILGSMVVVLSLFASLTVEIDAEHLRIRFGIGLIRKRFPLDQIDTCRPVSNPWIYGWGIRLTPHGWLYNVSGQEAVELKMKSGKTCRIGTDEPEVLTAALQEALDSLKPAPE
ncbi:MAG: hypothetical protein OXN90_05370 [Gemmatimonadota bacterium]|nr:hypothetical protein [Gemmatimonadota bacterium]